MKILPVKEQLLHADRQTYMTKLIVAFHNFAKRSKSIWCLFLIVLTKKIQKKATTKVVGPWLSKYVRRLCRVYAHTWSIKAAKCLHNSYFQELIMDLNRSSSP
jgi:hypothetical protein